MVRWFTMNGPKPQASSLKPQAPGFLHACKLYSYDTRLVRFFNFFSGWIGSGSLSPSDAFWKVTPPTASNQISRAYDTFVSRQKNIRTNEVTAR